jgi:formylmethanofuran dehydrogenase subunit B
MKNREQPNLEDKETIPKAQSEMYEKALRTLMNRTDNDAELVSALGAFMKGLDSKAYEGNANIPLDEDRIKKLTDFFKEKAEELANL